MTYLETLFILIMIGVPGYMALDWYFTRERNQKSLREFEAYFERQVHIDPNTPGVPGEEGVEGESWVHTNKPSKKSTNKLSKKSTNKPVKKRAKSRKAD